MGLIDFDNFYEETNRYILGQPKKADWGFVVRGKESEAAKAWLSYCDEKAIHDKRWKGRKSFFLSRLDRNDGLTMPCADPRFFDPDYKGGQAFYPNRREAVMPDESVRRKAAAMARDMVRDSKPPHEPKRPDWQGGPKSIEEVCAEMNEKPLGISPKLRSMLGLTNPESKEDAA